MKYYTKKSKGQVEKQSTCKHFGNLLGKERQYKKCLSSGLAELCVQRKQGIMLVFAFIA